MNSKVCIDKRIWYLVLFSVPLLLIAFLSSVINSTSLYRGSKAAGLAPTSVIKPTITPTPSNNVFPATCLLVTIKKRNGKNIVELSQKNPERIDKTKNLKIYSYSKHKDGSKVTYLSLQQPPLNTLVLTRIESDFILGSYSFLGVQGDIPTSSDEFIIEMIAKLNCESYVIPITSH